MDNDVRERLEKIEKLLKEHEKQLIRLNKNIHKLFEERKDESISNK